MDRIIPSKPAKYPSTNASESKAITVFRYILSEYVKTDIREMDKIPNFDGYLVITNENHEPTGKIEVQMKKMSDNCSGKPKYQCTLEFLSYCEDSILPVFLILVDTKSEVAYWLFISRELLKDLVLRIKPGSESINVKIPSKNIIRRENSEYLLEWQRICDDYLKKICCYDDLLLEHQTNLEKIDNILKQENGLVGIEKPEFKSIHKFLDILNMYLDTDFSVVKDLYYNSCWKLGIAYNNYSKDKITYLIYPINYNRNDLQIREISNKLKDELRKELGTCFVKSIFSNNPIHSQPERYAKELVVEKVKQLCDNKLLPLSHISIFREVIFEFIDELHDCLGLEVKNSYTIEELKYSFYIYLPIWVEEVLPNKNINLGYHPLFSPYIDPAFLLTQLNQEKREKLDKKVKERIKKYQFNNKKFLLKNNKFPLKFIFDFLESSSLNDLNELNRLYIPPNFHMPASNSRYCWEFNSPEEVFKNVMAFFKEFPNVYDTTIDSCFPKLKSKINFFSSFDTLVVVIEAYDNYPNSDIKPSIECYYLKNEDTNPEKEIKFYMKGREQIPINREMDFKSKICIDGKLYTAKSANYGILEFIFQDLPMFNYLYKTLREKMNDFFHNDE
jgi:hypothetical protein